MTLGIAGECLWTQDKPLANPEYNQNDDNNVHTNNYIQNLDALQENNLCTGDDHPIDNSIGVDPCEIYSNETNTGNGQSPLQHPGPLGPPLHISSMFDIQPTLEDSGSEPQDSGDDESEGCDTNDVVTFDPDIEPGMPMVNYPCNNPPPKSDVNYSFFYLFLFKI